uniref:potassium/sodium hyperpolarization-activated cyclic nucleotide-gated channel 2-like isoform X1 n=1 Tax=Styela clava TaxID=7725 RepID=UPI00193984F4|nr:potassium/sodium hyperpolarization-activated cyclic nucleotide-gated channel 2-like isoform X1 [Styela clava]
MSLASNKVNAAPNGHKAAEEGSSSFAGSPSTKSLTDAEKNVRELDEDKPTTFLAMNLDPVMVRKSSQHIDRIAMQIEKNYQEQEKNETAEVEYELDNLAKLRPKKSETGSSTMQASSMFLHPDKKMNFRRSVTGSMSIPVNKMSIKLYGSEKAVLQEQQRMEKAGNWIIHPYSNFRFIWDSLSLVILMANIILIPVAIAFWKDDEPGWLPFKLISDTWFLLDIIFNFRTGIVLDGPDSEVILDPKQIRVIYLKSWFIIDMISTFPFDLVFTIVDNAIEGEPTSSTSLSGVSAFRLLRLAKILALLRLLRLSRFIRYMKQWEEIFNFQYELALAFARIMNLIMLMLFICHINGCLQYMVPMFMSFPEDTWVSIRGLENPNVTAWERYSWSVFKSTSHMLCIGYGQFPPHGMIDLWVTFVSMVSGAMCFALFIGNATSLIQSMDASKRAYKEKYMQVKEYMQFRKLPIPLRRQISDYYENRFQGKMFDEDRILDELNHNLRDEIINHNCRDLVEQVPFFNEADPTFLSSVLSKLEFEVFLVNDTIVKEGSVGSKMYFINRGTVVIRSERHNIEQRLSDGCYFGEIALLQQNMRRVASVIAETYCYLYSLSVEDFNKVLDEYPKQRQKLQHVATARMQGGPNTNDGFVSTCSIIPLDGPKEKKQIIGSMQLENIEEETSTMSFS